MSPRRRSKAKRGWPPNLYERHGYFSWRHPATREEFGLGRDRARAFAEAVEANIHLAKLTRRPRLIHRIDGDAERSVAAWAAKYEGLQARANLADNTRRSYRSLSKRMVSMLGADTPWIAITALQVSEGLEAIAVTEGKARLAQALRNYMRDSFRESVVQGWRPDNPVHDTKLPAPVIVKRERLSLDVFMAAYERSRLVWLTNAMGIAITSAQRREDIAEAQFPAFRDGGWWCEQQSEKADHPHRIFIPYELKPPGFHLSLGDVVSQCRRTGVVSRYLVHQTVTRGNSQRGAQIWIDTISRSFAALIAELAIDWGEKDPPTFHEIRSLSERLYAAQGGVNTQHLLGHNDATTTALYHDTRGSEWVRVTTV